MNLVLDSGAIMSAARGNARVRSHIAEAHARDWDIVVPMVVLAATVRGRGSSDAPVNLVLASTGPHLPLDEPTARLAGELLATTGGSNAIGALVAAEAIHRAPAVVLTADHDDLAPLLADRADVVVAAI